MKKPLLLLLLSTTICNALLSQTIDSGHPLVNDEFHPCISLQEYEEMEREIDRNRALLGLNRPPAHRSSVMSTPLSWPIRPAAELEDCDHYYISAFVDLDPSSGLLDWNCGTRTYNGHRGVDIVPWPFIWDKMDNELVEVIAAAPGTIIAKVDGNPDRVCNGVGGGGTSNNYITVQHADGSTALYVHMKTGSLTNKTIGQTVTTGEYLGIVGSAGQSTGVHLHFELRSDGSFGSYIDPHFGNCNTVIGASWWAQQKPYVEPKIIKLSTHDNWPYMAACPNTVDTLHEQTVFNAAPGAQAVFHACTKHVLTNDSWNFRILNPDNSVFDTWTYTSLLNKNTSILGWNRTLPSASGLYTYEGTFNSITCSTQFTVQAPVGLEESVDCDEHLLIYPNPANEVIHFSQQSNVRLTNVAGQTLALATKVSSLDITSLPNGLYFLTLSDDIGKTLSHQRIIKE